MMKTKWLLMLVAAAMAILGLTTASQAAVKLDMFSVNFYMYPWDWTTQEQFDTITVEPDQSAGFGNWLTDGWENINMPWDPSGPQDPVTITSTRGSTATYTLTTCRNGGAYFWPAPRTTLLGDGNADMMDGHGNGTEDAGELIDFTISDIPFDVYDVVLYIGSQEAQFGDGTGKLVFNGTERDFTLTSGIFDGTFTEITDGTTPGNYILYELVTGSSFSVQVWGNGFNHIGLCGLQIALPGVRNPSPAKEAYVPIGDVDLSWTNTDPNYPGGSVYVDVWFGTDPNHPSANWTKVVAANPADPDRTTWTVNAPTEGTYYWQVNSYIYGAGRINEPNMVEGPLWSFYATPDVPPTSLDAGVDMITWSGQPVPLDATVVDDGVSALTWLWTADAPIGVTVAFNPGATVEDPAVTITKVPYTNASIVNAGFEDPPLIDGAYTWNVTPGWSGSGVGCWDPGDGTGAYNAYGGNAPEGENIAWVNGIGSLSQTLTETLAADTTYTLSLQVGKNAGYATSTYKVELLAGDTVLADDDNSIPVTVEKFETSTVTYTSGGATDPNIGLPLQIRLWCTEDGGEFNFDDVQLTANPPFPAPTGLSTVDLTLAVNDEYNPTPVTDSITIDVYDNACLAAVGAGIASMGPADFDENCITDLKDLAVMLAKWLVDYKATAAVPKP